MDISETNKVDENREKREKITVVEKE